MTEHSEPKPEEATVWVDPGLTSPAPRKAIVTSGGKVTWISCGCDGTIEIRGPLGVVHLELQSGVPAVFPIGFPNGEYKYEVDLTRCRSPFRPAHLQGTIIIVDP
jgi:hypothetical protein